MTTVIGGSSPSITFSDSTTQSTAALPLTGGSLTGNITSTGSISSVNTFGFKNRIINGAMVIDQRHSGSAVTFSGTGQATGGNYIVDRFQYGSFGGNFPSGVYTTLQQVSDAPTGFQSSLKVTANQTLTVGSSNARGAWVTQPIEGFNIYDCYNQSITISFWVKTSNIGTYSLVVQSGDVSAGYATSYIVTTANTWQKIIITLPLTTTNWTVVNYTNSAGMALVFGLLGDPTWIGTGTANTWVTGNIPYLWNCKNLYDTSGATWQVTGVQLEVGTQATAFDYRPYGTELQLCQRYFNKSFAQATAPANYTNSQKTTWVLTFAGGASTYGGRWVFPVNMRAQPTITFYNPQASGTAGYWHAYTSSTEADQPFGVLTSTDTGWSPYNPGGTSYSFAYGEFTASAEL